MYKRQGPGRAPGRPLRTRRRTGCRSRRRCELRHVPRDQLTFLARDNGAAHTAGGFYNLFAAWCAAAGLEPGLAPHGLRKAAARRLAEAGATAHQIAAVTGHRSLAEVTIYTAAADQARLAAQGMAKVIQLGASGRKRRRDRA